MRLKIDFICVFQIKSDQISNKSIFVYLYIYMCVSACMCVCVNVCVTNKSVVLFSFQHVNYFECFNNYYYKTVFTIIITYVCDEFKNTILFCNYFCFFFFFFSSTSPFKFQTINFFVEWSSFSKRCRLHIWTDCRSTFCFTNVVFFSFFFFSVCYYFLNCKFIDSLVVFNGCVQIWKRVELEHGAVTSTLSWLMVIDFLWTIPILLVPIVTKLHFWLWCTNLRLYLLE